MLITFEAIVIYFTILEFFFWDIGIWQAEK